MDLRLLLKQYERTAMIHVSIASIMHNPVLRKELMVRTIIAIQAREGIETTQEQAEAAYEKIQAERRSA